MMNKILSTTVVWTTNPSSRPLIPPHVLLPKKMLSLDINPFAHFQNNKVGVRNKLYATKLHYLLFLPNECKTNRNSKNQNF